MAGVWQGGGVSGSILILKPSSFGDIIHTLPAVMLLRRRWPKTRVTWLVNTEWAPLLQGSPVADQLILFPRREMKGMWGLGRFLNWVRKYVVPTRPALAVDYQGLMRTAVIGRMARPGQFFGSSDAREGARWLYDKAVPATGGVLHAVERYLHLSEAVIGEARTKTEKLEFPLPPGEKPVTAHALPNGYVLLHPFARGADKSLSAAQVAQVCEGCQPHPVVLVGRTDGLLPQLPANCYDLLGKTNLSELIWLTRRADFVISVDSGPAHLAAALGRPMVAIHTWSDPRKVGPYRADAWVCKGGRLIQFAELRTMDDGFFCQTGEGSPSKEALEEVCRLATSPSGSCA